MNICLGVCNAVNQVFLSVLFKGSNLESFMRPKSYSVLSACGFVHENKKKNDEAHSWSAADFWASAQQHSWSSCAKIAPVLLLIGPGRWLAIEQVQPKQSLNLRRMNREKITVNPSFTVKPELQFSERPKRTRCCALLQFSDFRLAVVHKDH